MYILSYHFINLDGKLWYDLNLVILYTGYFCLKSVLPDMFTLFVFIPQKNTPLNMKHFLPTEKTTLSIFLYQYLPSSS